MLCRNFRKWRFFNRDYYFILVISLLLSSPLFMSGLYKAHDLKIHVFRIIGTVVALKDFHIPPLIGPNLAGGFGYAWNIFYPPLSAYIPAIFKIILPTYISSLKVFIFLTIFLSGITMYQFAKEFLKSHNVALVAALLYLSAPYRIVDMYIRGALGEVLAFVFIPTLFHGLYNLLYGRGEKSYLITIGATGLLLTHNISALISLIIALIYMIINIKKLMNFEVVKLALLNAVFILVLSLFFIIPLLEQKLFGNFVVFLPNRMGSVDQLEEHGVYIHQLLFGKFQWGASAGQGNVTNEMPFNIGLQIVIPLLMTPIVYGKIKEKYNYFSFLAIGILATFATSIYFPWSKMPELFSFIQFPWRFLMISVFFLSIIAAQNLSYIINQIDIKSTLILTMIVFIYISPLITLTKHNPNITDTYFNNTDITLKNAYASADRAGDEYLPVNAFHHLGYLIQRNNESIVTSGDIKVLSEKKIKGKYRVKVGKGSHSSKIELPFLYYVGWNAKLSNGNKVGSIKVFETENGFVGIEIPKNYKGEIVVNFSGTIYTKISYIISLLSIIPFVIFIRLNRKLKGNKEIITADLYVN